METEQFRWLALFLVEEMGLLAKAQQEASVDEDITNKETISPEAWLAAGIGIGDKSLQGARLPEETRHSWMGWNQVTVAGHSETESTEESGGSGRAAVTGGDPIAGPGQMQM